MPSSPNTPPDSEVSKFPSKLPVHGNVLEEQVLEMLNDPNLDPEWTDAQTQIILNLNPEMAENLNRATDGMAWMMEYSETLNDEVGQAIAFFINNRPEKYRDKAARIKASRFKLERTLENPVEIQEMVFSVPGPDARYADAGKFSEVIFSQTRATYDAEEANGKTPVLIAPYQRYANDPDATFISARKIGDGDWQLRFIPQADSLRHNPDLTHLDCEAIWQGRSDTPLETTRPLRSNKKKKKQGGGLLSHGKGVDSGLEYDA